MLYNLLLVTLCIVSRNIVVNGGQYGSNRVLSSADTTFNPTDKLTSFTRHTTNLRSVVQSAAAIYDPNTDLIWIIGGDSTSGYSYKRVDTFDYKTGILTAQTFLSAYARNPVNWARLYNDVVYLNFQTGKTIQSYNLKSGVTTNPIPNGIIPGNAPCLALDASLHELYVLNGESNQFYIYNIISETWNSNVPFTTYQHLLGNCEVFNSKLYSISGKTNSKIESFDLIKRDNWIYVSDLIYTTKTAKTVVLDNGLIYVLGGSTDTTYSDTIQIFNTYTYETYVSSVTLSIGVVNLAATVVPNYGIWVFGGLSSSTARRNVIQYSNAFNVTSYPTCNMDEARYECEIRGCNGCGMEDTLNYDVWLNECAETICDTWEERCYSNGYPIIKECINKNSQMKNDYDRVCRDNCIPECDRIAAQEECMTRGCDCWLESENVNYKQWLNACIDKLCSFSDICSEYGCTFEECIEGNCDLEIDYTSICEDYCEVDPCAVVLE